MSSEKDEAGKPLLTHLQELRKLLLWLCCVLVAGFLVAFIVFSDPVLSFITGPISARNVTVIYTSVSEAFVTRIRVSFVTGAILTSPVLIWLIWRFVKPGLYADEIRRFRILFISCLCLFILGVVFCYQAVYSLALDFFLMAGKDLAVPYLALDQYVSFLFSFLLPFGIAFELPVIMYMLSKHGLIDARKLAGARKYVILIIVTASAFLTPPDVISQIMLSLPLYLLFEVGLFVGQIAGKSRG